MRKLLLLAGVVSVLAVVGCAGRHQRSFVWHTHGYSYRVHHYGHGFGWLGRAASCTYHGWRLYEDSRHGSYGWAAYQTWRTVHRCGRLL